MNEHRPRAVAAGFVDTRRHRRDTPEETARSSRGYVLEDEPSDMLQANSSIDVNAETGARCEFAEVVVLRKKVPVEHATRKELVESVVIERIAQDRRIAHELLEHGAIDS